MPTKSNSSEVAVSRRGGPRPGSGRPRGKAQPNPMNKARDRLITDALAGKAITPLQLILGVMNGTLECTPLQLAAAQMAAPYVHPKLANITAKTEVHHSGGALVLTVGKADPIEAARIYQRLMEPDNNEYSPVIDEEGNDA